MIKKQLVKAIIRNFQSHKESIIHFGKITVILGPSDSGKSAIIRAIKWALYNEPDGDEFIREDEKWAEVELWFDDNTCVIRHKGDKNFYELVRSDGSRLHLEGFGAGPIDEVMRFHGMLGVDFLADSCSLNIADQLSQPFFIAETPVRRAEIIGLIAKTEPVDEAIKDLASEIRSAKVEKNRLKSAVADYNKQLAQYTDLPQMEYVLKDAKAALSEMESLSSVSARIKSTQATLFSLLREKGRLDSILATEADVDAVCEAVSQISTLLGIKKSIQDKKASLISIMDQKIEIENTLRDAPLEDINACIDQLDYALTQYKNATTIRSCQNRLFAEMDKFEEINQMISREQEINDIINDLGECQLRLSDITAIRAKQAAIAFNIRRSANGVKVMKDLEVEYKTNKEAYMNKLKEDPQCPFCRSELTKEKLAKLEVVV